MTPDLVAGDRLRREQERVPGLQLDPLIGARRELRRRRPPLALAARRQHEELLARQLAGILRIEHRREAVEHLRRLRRRQHLPHRPPDHHDRPPRRLAGLGQRLQPRDVRGEGGRHHHPVASRISARSAPRATPPTGPAAPRRHWSNRRSAPAHQPRRSRGRARAGIRSPTTGVGSTLKSAECTTRPAGVSITRLELSGIECETGTKPTVNGPACTTRGQASTWCTSVVSCPARSILSFACAAVKRRA
jgi:hypothetical protein